MNEIEGQKDYHMIRPMMAKDTDCVLEMMQVFYASPAVFTNGSDNIFLSDIAACVGDSPYLEGYIFEEGMEILGYAMIAKSFSTEFGKPCMWIEDLYIREAYRGTGLGSKFLDYIEAKYPEALLRLEVEEENIRARSLYERLGYRPLGYSQMDRALH